MSTQTSQLASCVCVCIRIKCVCVLGVYVCVQVWTRVLQAPCSQCDRGTLLFTYKAFYFVVQAKVHKADRLGLSARSTQQKDWNYRITTVELQHIIE